MKALILTILLAISAHAQTVQVTQGFVDDATKAFIELRAERSVNAAQERELTAKNELIKTQNLLIDSLKLGIETRDAQIKAISALKCDTTSLFWGIIKKKTCR
jgi:hypothetical protein